MTHQFVDATCLILAALLPIPLVLRWNLLGVAIGTLVVWGSLVLGGMLLTALDPSRDAGVLDPIWILFGWVGGLLYCIPIYLAKRCVTWLRDRIAVPKKNATAGPRVEHGC